MAICVAKVISEILSSTRGISPLQIVLIDPAIENLSMFEMQIRSLAFAEEHIQNIPRNVIKLHPYRLLLLVLVLHWQWDIRVGLNSIQVSLLLILLPFCFAVVTRRRIWRKITKLGWRAIQVAVVSTWNYDHVPGGGGRQMGMPRVEGETEITTKLVTISLNGMWRPQLSSTLENASDLGLADGQRSNSSQSSSVKVETRQTWTPIRAWTMK